MRKTLLVLAVGIVCFSGAPEGKADTDQELRLLRAENRLLKATVAQRDRAIETLKKECKALKAEPAQVEIQTLRKELAEAKKVIENLSKELDKAKPVHQKGVKITSHDLTPESVKKADYRGAELLLDGYVIDTSAKQGEFRAIVAAGMGGPRGNPIMIMTRGKVDYQIQVHLKGELAAKLRAGDISRRVRGIVREIEVVEKGKMITRTGLGYDRGWSEGILIIVTLDKITIR